MSRDAPAQMDLQLPPDARLAVVTARFNASMTDKLLEGCRERLAELKIDASRVAVHRVPGAFELPLAAKLLAETGRFAAVICLGCVIRGDTPHFDYVAGQCAAGIQQASVMTGVPIIFGVLTTHTSEQALERLGGVHGHAGRRAAEAAVEMAMLADQVKSLADHGGAPAGSKLRKV